MSIPSTPFLQPPHVALGGSGEGPACNYKDVIRPARPVATLVRFIKLLPTPHGREVTALPTPIESPKTKWA